MQDLKPQVKVSCVFFPPLGMENPGLHKALAQFFAAVCQELSSGEFETLALGLAVWSLTKEPCLIYLYFLPTI